MKAIAYVRVSTREQDEEVQRKAIEEFAESKGIEVVKFYVDRGVSGSRKFSLRPSGSKLLEELDSVKPDIVLAWSLDRIGRTMLDTLNTVIELENRGYKVVTVKEEWLQTLDPNIRKLILTILSWVAEFERKRIRERQEEAWKMGKQKGRPKVEIPVKIVKNFLAKGLSKKDVYRILVAKGYLKYKEKGKEKTLSYPHYLRRLKELKIR